MHGKMIQVDRHRTTAFSGAAAHCWRCYWAEGLRRDGDRFVCADSAFCDARRDHYRDTSER